MALGGVKGHSWKIDFLVTLLPSHIVWISILEHHTINDRFNENMGVKTRTEKKASGHQKAKHFCFEITLKK